MREQKQVLKKAQALQQEAKMVLTELGLMKILQEISEPKIVGSVFYGLMVVKDIDIHADVAGYDIEKIVNLLPKLALLPTIQKVQFNNYRELRRDYRKDRVYFPHAYYVGLRSIQASGEWKIDIWFAKQGEVNEYNDSRLQNLSDEQREFILQLKEMWRAEDGYNYKDDVVSVDFYKAVLDYGAKTAEDFQRYLQSKK